MIVRELDKHMYITTRIESKKAFCCFQDRSYKTTCNIPNRELGDVISVRTVMPQICCASNLFLQRAKPEAQASLPSIILGKSSRSLFAYTTHHTSPTMRPLTDTETKTLFEKLANYTGRSLNNLLTDTAPAPGGKAQPDRYVFRVQKDRVYYVRESLANLAT